MNLKNNKKLIFGALSAVVASVAAGVLVKNNIDKKTKNVSEENEFIRRTKTNPEIMKELATDTAVEKNGTVYPVSSAYSKDNLAVTEYAKGNVLMYSNPDRKSVV